MRILQVNKFLYRRAGAEAYVLDLVELLKGHGQEVRLWGEEAPLNFDRREGLWRDLKKFGHMLWSVENARKFERALKEFKPDVVHLHNIYHHISPAILKVAARYRVPVVMTVHDWHLLNPNYSLFDHGEICARNGLRAVFHRCIKNSYAASFADVVEWRLHKWMGVYEKNVAQFLAPNDFVKDRLVRGGMDGKKIAVAPLFVNSKFEIRNSKFGDYVLYAGRLTTEKGVYVLLEIAKRLPEIQFMLAGEGAELEKVKCKITNEKLLNVEVLGFLEKAELQHLLQEARMVLVPSLWEELSPLSVLEAMAAGKVVVASSIGGIRELIKQGETGFLVTKSPDGDLVTDWVDKIRKLYNDKTLLEKIGHAAQEYIQRVHGSEKHYERILEIYRASRH